MRVPTIIPLLLLALLSPACSEKDDPVEVYNPVLSVPGDYASISAAAEDAVPGDVIILEYRVAPYAEDITLPPDVSLKSHESNTDTPYIEGSITVIGSGEGTELIGLHVSNDEGSGLLVIDSTMDISDCWFENCRDAGIELVGYSPVTVEDCDMEACAVGVLIRDSSHIGHYKNYDHAENTAPSIMLCNFIANGEPDTPLNIEFDNVSAPGVSHGSCLGCHATNSGVVNRAFKVGVKYNYWGEDVNVLEILDPATDGIWDMRDETDPLEKGLADTEMEGFPTSPNIHERNWRD